MMSGVRVAGMRTEPQPSTAPPTISTTQPQQPGVSRVRVAGSRTGSEQTSSTQSGTHSVNQSLNPDAAKFVMRDASLVSGGELSPDLTEDWAAVQGVQAGGAGHQGNSHHCLWDNVSQWSSSIWPRPPTRSVFFDVRWPLDCSSKTCVASKLPEG